MSDLDKDQVTLSAADAAAVDAILERDAAAQAAVDPVRHARVEAWLKILASAPATAPADLAVRTLAAIQSAPLPFPQPQTTAQEAPAAPTGRWRRRLAEFGAMAVAAMLLLLVTLQAMGQAQRSRARVACATNLQKLATGFNDYADFANGELPCIALPANRNWLRAGEKLAARNNTANLIPLVNHNFAPTTAFYCPGTPLKAPPPARRFSMSFRPSATPIAISMAATRFPGTAATKP